METSSTQSIVSALGGGSGVDMMQLARDLAATRFQPQKDQLNARSEALETRISAASALRGQLNQLASAFGERIRSGDLAPQPAIGNGSVAAVSLQSGSNASGSFSLEVSQLAASQTLASSAYSAADDLVGEGTLTIRFGTNDASSFTPDIDRATLDISVSATDTLQSLADKISAGGEGLTAYVAQNASGAQLVIKGEDGAPNGFVVETVSSAATPTATPGDLTYLAWTPALDSGQLRQGAQDAQFTLDGVQMQSDSNDVSNLPSGILLSLTAVNTGDPTLITFADSTPQISAVMNDFVTALGDITQQLRESAAPLSGELGNDPAARTLKRALANLSTQIVMPNAAEGEPATLGDLGLEVDRHGSLSLDNKRLSKALSETPQAVASMFTTGLHGVYATMDDLSRSMSSRGDPGSLAGSIERYTDQASLIDERLASIAEKQERLREQFTKTFVASERNVSASQSTLNFIKSQIAVWNQDS